MQSEGDPGGAIKVITMKVTRRPTIRKILVPLDPSSYARAATEYACQIAMKHEAQICGLSVLDSPEIRAAVMPSRYGSYELAQQLEELHYENAREEMAQFEEEFTQRCNKHHVLSTETQLEGVPVDLVLEAATLFDLMVVGLRTYFHFETRRGEGELLTKILAQTSTPILAVPAVTKPLKKVLITYDGSPASARAVRDFVIFALPFDMEIDLFLSDEDDGRLDFHANKLQLYLQDHELPVSRILRYTSKPLDAINDGVTDGYDLVVCGMHSRRPLHDFFVGSFAKRLIEDKKSALFLSH